MFSAILILLSFCFLGTLGFFKYRRDKKAGKTEEKLKGAENVISNVKKSKNTIARLNDDMRDKLRKRYNIK